MSVTFDNGHTRMVMSTSVVFQLPGPDHVHGGGGTGGDGGGVVVEADSESEVFSIVNRHSDLLDASLSTVVPQ